MMKQFSEDRLYMSANGFKQAIGPDNPTLRGYHESLIAAEYDRCHPDDSFADLKHRARFSKEDQSLLKDWMSLAADMADRFAGEQVLRRSDRLAA
jgi:hypothetical protein